MKIVIFCGGYGTRMWPASRKSYPKQFYPLLGGKSFFRITYERFARVYKPEDIVVSTEAKYVKFIHEQAPEVLKHNIILEPERRDNLAAIGLAVALINKMYPNEVMFFSWSDHLIKNEKEFLASTRFACEYAEETGRPVSVNQDSTFPSVHNGWLKVGRKVSRIGDQTLYEIEKFIEKPNLQIAKKLFRSNKYIIHTGYGAWRTDTLLSYYDKYAHDTYLKLDRIAEAYGTGEYEKVLKSEYSKIEKVSIDYGLFEKIPSHERLTLRGDFGWQDVGTWQLMFEALAKDAESNLVEGKSLTSFIDAEGNLVFGESKKMISIIGLSNIAVIDTPTGLLVSALDKTSHVKELFATLEKENPEFVN